MLFAFFCLLHVRQSKGGIVRFEQTFGMLPVVMVPTMVVAVVLYALSDAVYSELLYCISGQHSFLETLGDVGVADPS